MNNQEHQLNDHLDLTVAIPTYNGESRLPKVLERLRSQFQISHLKWEIIIIDNNSQDNTAQIIQNYQTDWTETYPLKYYFEPKQGAAFARLRAVREANGQLICFLDDDNLPDHNWLAAAYNFALEHPQAGAYGGQIHGDFEINPPENFERIQGFLAIREHGTNPHQFDPENLRLPPAAALVVRKQAWLESVPNRPILTGRVGGIMIGGEDYEALLYIYKAGWEIWYNPAMHTYHQIPHWRLERDYLLSLARGCGMPTYQLRTINARESEKLIILIKTILGNLRRVILHIIKYKWQIKTDLIAAFEIEFLLASMLSPFYLLNTKFNQVK